MNRVSILGCITAVLISCSTESRVTSVLGLNADGDTPLAKLQTSQIAKLCGGTAENYAQPYVVQLEDEATCRARAFAAARAAVRRAEAATDSEARQSCASAYSECLGVWREGAITSCSENLSDCDLSLYDFFLCVATAPVRFQAVADEYPRCTDYGVADYQNDDRAEPASPDVHVPSDCPPPSSSCVVWSQQYD